MFIIERVFDRESIANVIYFQCVNIDRLLRYVISTRKQASNQDAFWDMWKWSISQGNYPNDAFK